ncbi:MAG: RpiB/LacA/LacB family sugar-phosphate isomerase [Puniceicoccales bacterium]|jgi:ribose 5-phosphate isomerase B|nr:RpiB/LacA/LacB family sugar-phosphate isomerase [Puniceicoccales bacterium]
MKVSIGSDHGGYAVAGIIIQYLRSKHWDTIAHLPLPEEGRVDYPDYAFEVADDISNQKARCGILVCRTGMGMCIAANKCKNIRAALCMSVALAVVAREYNDANILCLGSDYLDEGTILAIVDSFLKTQFSGDRHQLRIEKIFNYEKKHYH